MGDGLFDGGQLLLGLLVISKRDLRCYLWCTIRTFWRDLLLPAERTDAPPALVLELAASSGAAGIVAVGGVLMLSISGDEAAAEGSGRE